MTAQTLTDLTPEQRQHIAATARDVAERKAQGRAALVVAIDLAGVAGLTHREIVAEVQSRPHVAEKVGGRV